MLKKLKIEEFFEILYLIMPLGWQTYHDPLNKNWFMC